MPVEPVDVLRRNRREALATADQMGGRRVLKLLKESHVDLQRRLRNTRELGAGSDSFTAARLQVALAQVAHVAKHLTRKIQGELVDQAEDVAEDAAGHVADYLRAAEKKFRGISRQGLRIDEAAMLDRAVQGARASVLRRLASTGTPAETPEDAAQGPSPAKRGILERYGLETVGTFERVMQRGVITGAPWGEIRDELEGESPFLQGQPRFWAERIARTETLGASNRSNWESIRAADDELGDLVKIVSEVFDDRTGWDSYQVHGQIRRPDEPFEWAEGAYMNPPNRPNDRGIVVPHRISWPLPPYLAAMPDAAVVAAYFRQRKTGSPGPRPRMTTVPLSRFGR